MLEAAVSQPMAGIGDTEFYPSLFDKAAVLARGIICGHCFTDGNKRAGMMAAVVFLRMNGYHYKPPSGNFVELALRIAIHKLGVPLIAKALEERSQLIPIPEQLPLPGF